MNPWSKTEGQEREAEREGEPEGECMNEVASSTGHELDFDRLLGKCISELSAQSIKGGSTLPLSSFLVGHVASLAVTTAHSWALLGVC